MSNMTSLLVSRVKRSAVRQINETASICLQRIRKTKASLDYLNNTARHGIAIASAKFPTSNSN